MKKLMTLSFFLMIFGAFYSQKYVFKPSFDKNKVYAFKLTHEESAADEFNQKVFHNEYNTKVNFSVLQEVGGYYLCSWKIVSYKKTDKKELYESNLYDFLEGIDIKFKLSLDGSYYEVSNENQLVNYIKEKITDSYVKDFKKKSAKNRKEYPNLIEIKKNPERIIRSLEKDIIKYFKYYNVSFSNNEVVNNIRKDFIFSNYILPYKSKISLETSDNGYLFSVDNTLDKEKMKDENWESIYTGISEKISGFKESYDISATEKYYFSSVGNVYKIEISAKEKFNYNNNMFRYSTFVLSLE